MKKNKITKIVTSLFFVGGFIPMVSGTSTTITYNAGIPKDYFPKNKELDSKNLSDILKQDRFDLRDYNLVTPVKNQGIEGLCWAYSIVSAVESSILRQAPGNYNMKNLDIDENQYDYISNVRTEEANKLKLAGSDHFENELGVGNYIFDSALMALQKTSFANQGVKKGYVEPIVNIKNIIQVDWSNKEELKKAIVKYGGIAFSMTYPYRTFNAQSIFYNNNYTEPMEGVLAHACTIVGWDDTYYKSNFKPNPATQKGAWIVKNSWGTKYQSEGYFYLSYDSPLQDAVAFEIEKDFVPQNAYYYDGRRNYTEYSTDSNEYAVVFPVRKANDETTEKLKSINLVLTGKNINIHSKIFIGDDKNIDLNGKNPAYEWDTTVDNSETNGKTGAFTLELPKAFELPKNKYFAVVVKLSSPDKNLAINYSYEPNSVGDLTFLKIKDGTWSNAKEILNGSFKIKAYTYTEPKNKQLEIENNSNPVSEPTTSSKQENSSQTNKEQRVVVSENSPSANDSIQENDNSANSSNIEEISNSQNSTNESPNEFNNSNSEGEIVDDSSANNENEEITEGNTSNYNSPEANNTSENEINFNVEKTNEKETNSNNNDNTEKVSNDNSLAESNKTREADNSLLISQEQNVSSRTKLILAITLPVLAGASLISFIGYKLFRKFSKKS
ncbi:C1 family peptidase [Mycoplasmopsis meleagridis]|uniref:C1 family peptidase n=1 Tax=Mycoplasmopsis meleagridis TaxID=29561 RepID=UPI00073D5547|nr:C1 family peptidase [Mycoplasmopsis meleagridis]KUH47450.1 hypothetical protein ASB56_01110 [Mycoplasmopsis meleagridis]